MTTRQTGVSQNSGIAYDEQGFLVGSVVDVGRMRADISETAKNTHEILSFLKGRATSSREIIRYKGQAQTPTQTANTAVQRQSRQRDASGRFTGLGVGQQDTQEVSGSRQRDASGRFTGAVVRDTASKQADKQSQRQNNTDLANAITQSISNNSQIDPTVAAMSEVAEPMNRVYQFMRRGKEKEQSKQTSILSKMLKFMTARKVEEDSAERKAQRQRQDIIDGQNNANKSGGFLKFLSFLAPLFMPVVALLGAILAAIGKMALGGMGKVFGNDSARRDSRNRNTPNNPSLPQNQQNNRNDRSQPNNPNLPDRDRQTNNNPNQSGKDGKLKSFAKKIPFIGALIGGGLLASDVMANESDDGKTRKEKDIENGNAIGGTVGGIGGAVGGAMAGAAIGSVVPVVGTVIGGLVGGIAGSMGGEIIGQEIGKKFGEWTNQLRDADIAGSLKSSWQGFTDWAGSAWQNVSSFAQTTWSNFTTTASDKWQGVTDFAKTTWDSVSKKSSELFDTAKPYLDSFAQTITDFGSKANDWILNLTGIDLGAKFDSLIDSAKTAFNSVKQKVSDGVKYLSENTTVGKAISEGANYVVSGQAKEDVKNTASKAWDATKNAYSDTKSYLSGKVSDFTGKTESNKSALTSEMQKSGITDPKEQAMFLSQMSHESGGFRRLDENLNYSSVDRIKSTFGKNKAIAGMSDDQIGGLVNNPEALANTVYGNRMGNTEAGDGYKFRGRGFTQLTGRSNYEQASKDLGIDLVNNPDLASTPETAAKISTWYWKKNNLGALAQNGDVLGVTKKINGGTNGLDDRKNQYQSFLAETQKGKYANDVAPKTDTTVLASSTQSNAISQTNSTTPSISAPVTSVASTSMPTPQSVSVPSIPIERVTPSPAVNELASSGSSGSGSENSKDNQVVIAENIGRDLKDRRIAHIATGGIA